jgi:SAM-dependent methyltransferase
MDLREQAMTLDQALGHWYYLNKFEIVKKCLDPEAVSSCLDFGCGRGVFAHLLKRRRPGLGVVAYDPNGVEQGERGVRFVNTCTEGAHDVVLLMDVLEHCPDPAAVLRQAGERMRPGGSLLVTVPAFQSLWSFHDVFLGHYRRYDLAALRELCEAEGFRVREGFYLFSYLLPPAWIRRRLLPAPKTGSDLRPSAPWVNGVMGILGKIEAPFARFNRLGGLTVCAVLEKSR